MPFIDYYLDTDAELTKDKLSESELTLSLTTKLDLGKDNRTWNKEQLKALKLLLCNIVTNPNEDNGVFLYSRNKKTKPQRFNPNAIGYSSLFFVIDKLVEAEILVGVVAQPRTKDNNPKKLSEFTVTQESLDFAYSLGINRLTVSSSSPFHVRLRDTLTDEDLEFKDNEYTSHIETLMSAYCSYLNQNNILLSTENYEEHGFTDLGLRGQRIHLYRNFRNYTDHKDYREDIGKLFYEMSDPNFNFGGRSGGYWQGSKNQHREDREYILINGNKTKKADFPCSHTNLCYRNETNNWYQTETYEELKEEGREHEDAYIVADVPRPITKQMVLFMLNVKSRRAVSGVFNKWIEQKNEDDSRNASDEVVALYKKVDYSNTEIMDLLEKKHQKIQDYFYKGKLAGQIIQWHEANLMHHLAMQFINEYDFTVLTVYDELIVEEQHQPMVKDFMFSSGSCDLCDSLDLMSQIKNL
jgi:hypothetical protein|tara:strand:+ start:2227 stop:3630 length:1404 start_codon:yes stop_codon:yes gene_type:complete